VKRLALLIAILAALSLVAADAIAQSGPPPCTTSPCRAHIRVEGMTTWKSPYRLKGQLEELDLKAGRKSLMYEPAGSCKAYFYGNGVVARLSACGKGKVRMKLRAVALDRKPVTLRLAYKLAR
jgi:hypothetical protein